jgi:hypothetical protein
MITSLLCVVAQSVALSLSLSLSVSLKKGHSLSFFVFARAARGLALAGRLYLLLLRSLGVVGDFPHKGLGWARTREQGERGNGCRVCWGEGVLFLFWVGGKGAPARVPQGFARGSAPPEKKLEKYKRQPSRAQSQNVIMLSAL